MPMSFSNTNYQVVCGVTTTGTASANYVPTMTRNSSYPRTVSSFYYGLKGASGTTWTQHYFVFGS